MGINQFDPEPDPHFRFLCEHGAWTFPVPSNPKSKLPSNNLVRFSAWLGEYSDMYLKCKTRHGALDKACFRALDKVHIFISIMPISSLNPMLDHLLESSHRYESNKWPNIGFSEEITQVESIDFHIKHLIWSSDAYCVIINNTFCNKFFISKPITMMWHLFESFPRDDSNEW